MAKTTVQETAVVLPASVNFHQVLNALDEFVDKYPIERASNDVVARIRDAATRLQHRLNRVYMEKMVVELRGQAPNGDPDTIVPAPAPHKQPPYTPPPAPGRLPKS